MERGPRGAAARPPRARVPFPPRPSHGCARVPSRLSVAAAGGRAFTLALLPFAPIAFPALLFLLPPLGGGGGGGRGRRPPRPPEVARPPSLARPPLPLP